MHALNRAMVADYASDKVRGNCFCPGITDTPFFLDRSGNPPDHDHAGKNFIARQSFSRFGKTWEIAEGMLFLITNDFCTGTILSVDGGMRM
ncbi:MAG: SDR family oxidoreductase [Candidatus Sigynarchaeota archaeon]